MPAEISFLHTLSVSPAANADDWRAARRLVDELVTWMCGELGTDPREAQHGSAEEFRDMAGFYSLPHGIFLIGRVDGRPAGSMGIRLLDADTAELKRVWVTPEARGRGLAPRMLERSFDAARVLGATRLRLETEPGLMATAVEMYIKAGFERIPHYSPLGEKLPTLLSMEKRVA